MANSRRRDPSPEPVIQLVIALGRVRKRFMHLATSALEAQGDSLLLWSVLLHLGKVSEISQAELANATLQHPAGISRLLDELEQGKTVRRVRDRKDRRKLLVRLTQLGRTRFERMRLIVQACAESCFAPLREDERDAMCELLNKVAGDVQGCSWTGAARPTSKPARTASGERRGRSVPRAASGRTRS